MFYSHLTQEKPQWFGFRGRLKVSPDSGSAAIVVTVHIDRRGEILVALGDLSCCDKIAPMVETRIHESDEHDHLDKRVK